MKKEVFFIMGILILFSTGTAACAAAYKNPPKSLQKSDLVGVWQTKYGKNEVDTITIGGDGSYQQKYINEDWNYIYETGWRSWRLENRPDGSIYVHFSGGRYYLEGIRRGELDGRGDFCPPDCNSGFDPFPFYDPYANVDIEMVNELVLSVRADTRGNIVFHHMWTSSDEGFPIIGGGTEIFRRVDIP
jgi:hypothetical protein